MSDTSRTDTQYKQWETLEEARDFALQLERENKELRRRVEELEEKYSYIVAENVKLCNENSDLADALRGMLDRYAPTHSALCFTLRTNGTSAPCCCDNAEQVARGTLARYADHKK